MSSSVKSRIASPESPNTGPADEAAAVQVLNQVALGYILSAALNVALELGIADRLADGPRTAEDLAKEAGVKEDGLYRVLRALASGGIFEEQESRTFALNVPAKMMLRQARGSLHDLGRWMTDPFHFRVYAEMLHSVTTGQPAAEKVTGMPVFEFFAREPRLSSVFNNAMTSWSGPTVAAALKAYDFSGIHTLVDVAGGHGLVLTSVLRQYPAMEGILFDLDHVVAGADPLIQAAGVGNRIKTVSGDFFKAVPAGDAYIMKNIIHDWDDDRAIAILKNIRTALAERRDGRVILLEAVVAAANRPDFGKLIDLEMLLMPGGRERTSAEFASLFERAGFTLARIVPTESPLSVVEARIA